jgi:predicted DNA-binding WGR domain protein
MTDMKNVQHYGVKSAKGGGKFWELSVVGTTLTEREGRIGDKGKQKKAVYPDRPTAHAQAEKLVAEKKAAGFLLVPVKPLPDTEVAPSVEKPQVPSAVWAAAPVEWQTLEKQFQSLCERIKKPYRQEMTDALGSRFKAGAWAWDPVAETRTWADIDRLGEVVMGPLFTSPAHEWPTRDGRPMAPLIQLDLARASQLSGLPLGDGLVQVWMPHKAIAGEDQYVRAVPRAAVNRADLTPVPEMPADLDPLQFPETPGAGFQITSWGNPRYTTPLAQGFQAHYTLKQLTADAALAQEIQAFDQALAERVSGSAACFSPANAHLFGTFAEVQYAPQDRPQPLFCFDGEAFGMVWGDGGNAQLFFTLGADGAVVFSFDWSSH